MPEKPNLEHVACVHSTIRTTRKPRVATSERRRRASSSYSRGFDFRIIPAHRSTTVSPVRGGCDVEEILPRLATNTDLLIPLAEQRLARTALNRLSKPVREGKGRLLYLVGPAGSGKSALIHEFLREIPDNQIVTASEFAAQLAESSDKKELAEFQERFRSVSVFCCEDIHAISGRPQTQQQLLAIVDELLADGHDVITSSTKMPGQLEAYLPKLVNRFRGGTILAVKLPGPDSRAALLRHFAQQRKIIFPRDALALLAESLTVSARELAGLVTQLAEHKRPIKRETVEELLREDHSVKRVTPLVVTKAVAAEFGVTLAALRSSQRSQVLVLPRQSAMWLCRKLCGTPLTKLGDFFERQHSSVLHAIRRQDERLKADAKLRQRIAKIETSIVPSTRSSNP